MLVAAAAVAQRCVCISAAQLAYRVTGGRVGQWLVQCDLQHRIAANNARGGWPEAINHVICLEVLQPSTQTVEV
jgi:hypothetical protein